MSGEKEADFPSKSIQAAAYLQEQIQSGRWNERLPSERALAAQIGIGRTTLRAALAILQQKGLLRERNRKGNHLSSTIQKPHMEQNLSVGLLLPMPIAHTTHRTLHWIDEFRRLLYQGNTRLVIYEGYFWNKPALFRKRTLEVHHDCWVLAYPMPKFVEWCANSGLRAIAFGCVDESHGISNVDIHYQALSRHAVGRMVQLGHQHLQLITPQRDWGADIESQKGFLEGVATSSDFKVTGRIDTHDGTVNGICRLVERLLQRDPKPTAWLIASAPHFLTILMHLKRLQIDVPGTISLICQDSEPWQNFITPSPARYVANIRTLAKQTNQLFLRALSGKQEAERQLRLMPEFIMGDTLGPIEYANSDLKIP